MEKRTVYNALIWLVVLAALVFRLVGLSKSPPSLFGDELDVGYHAYSILKTGRDYQGNFLPVNFHSISEWRTPLYIYSAVPTVAMFGISPLGVRLPAVIFGTLSVLGIYLLGLKLFENRGQKGESVAFLASILFAANPWSLQYSRAGFEVTEMIFLILLGTYLFLKSLSNSKILWLSLVCFLVTPLIYSTAKLFTPVFMLLLFLIYKKEILSFKKPDLIKAVVVGFVIGIPLIYGTLFKGGTQRIGDINIFTYPQMEQIVGINRDLDSKLGFNSFASKLMNNKYVYWGTLFSSNYLGAFSPEFLFSKGDVNLRQSIGSGMFYLIEFIPLIFGLIFLFGDSAVLIRTKWLMALWLLIAPVASSMTVGGNNHATRLILMLPILVFLISYGWVWVGENFKVIPKHFLWIFCTLLYILSFAFYLHEYYYIYPVKSQKWWHYGWEQAVGEIKRNEDKYEKIIISMRGEPAWIFFAAYYQYNPKEWQKNYPLDNKIFLPGFGEVSYIGKFYFGSPGDDIQIYGIGKYLDQRTLYLANFSEIPFDLDKNPEKIPEGLRLISTIRYLDSSPAIYLFSGR